MSTTVWFLCNDRSLVWSSSLWSLAKFTNTYKKKGHVTHQLGFSLIQGNLYMWLPELVMGFSTLLCQNALKDSSSKLVDLFLSLQEPFGIQATKNLLGQVWSEKRSSLLCGVSFCFGREYWIFWPGKIVKREAGTAAYSDAFPWGHFQGRHAQRTPQRASGLGLPLQFSPLWCNHLQTCKQDGQHRS